MLLSFLRRVDRARVVPVVACLTDGPFVREVGLTGTRVLHVHAGRLRHPWSWAGAVGRIATVARHAHVVLSWQVKGHYYGTPAARLARVPCAWWDHGIRPARGEPRYAVDARLPASIPADLVVCSSFAAAARHVRARVIHPGISLEFYERVSRPNARARLGIPEGAPVVGIAGRLQPWKGQHVFLRAASRVAASHRDARFVVIGGTPGGFSAAFPEHLSRLAADLGIADRVSFLGHRDDVPALLPGLDVFVNASDAEPFGIVTVEAMAAGVPVVGTNSGGTPEIIDDGATGVLVPSRDDAAMAVAIERYLDDGSFAATIAAAGRARAFERFSEDRMTRDIEALAEELAGGKQP